MLQYCSSSRDMLSFLPMLFGDGGGMEVAEVAMSAGVLKAVSC